jgi:xanthine dehydrogenase YagS FAD-binding subunit
MRPFSYERAADLAAATRQGSGAGQGETDTPTQFLAGGTTLIDLMKLDVLRPQRLVDLRALRSSHAEIEADASGLRLGALATMAEAAVHPAVLGDYPVIAQSLQLAASAQIRNVASLGGNVLQRTRCPTTATPAGPPATSVRPAPAVRRPRGSTTITLCSASMRPASRNIRATSA